MSVDLDRLDAVEGGFGFVCPRCAATAVLAPAVGSAPAKARDDIGSALSSGRVDAMPDAIGAALPSPARPTSPAARAGSAGLVECPKCAHRQPPGADACHRCGLMFAYAATGRARLPGDPLDGHPAAASIRARWQALAADLDDARGHHDFIRMCAESELLEFAGQSYRRLADAMPEDTRVAGYRQQVLKAAMARVGQVGERAMSADRSRVRRMFALLVAAIVLLVFALGYYLLTRYQIARQFDG
ncbi:MAG: hypothetical protein R3F65_03295 [bacterium]